MGRELTPGQRVWVLSTKTGPELYVATFQGSMGMTDTSLAVSVVRTTRLGKPFYAKGEHISVLYTNVCDNEADALVLYRRAVEINLANVRQESISAVAALAELKAKQESLFDQTLRLEVELKAATEAEVEADEAKVRRPEEVRSAEVKRQGA